MAFSTSDKCKVLATNPACKAVLDKYVPGLTDDPTFPMAYGMAFKALAAFPQVGLTPDKLNAIAEELAAIE